MADAINVKYASAQHIKRSRSNQIEVTANQQLSQVHLGNYIFPPTCVVCSLHNLPDKNNVCIW